MLDFPDALHTILPEILPKTSLQNAALKDAALPLTAFLETVSLLAPEQSLLSLMCFGCKECDRGQRQLYLQPRHLMQSFSMFRNSCSLHWHANRSCTAFQSHLLSDKLMHGSVSRTIAKLLQAFGANHRNLLCKSCVPECGLLLVWYPALRWSRTMDCATVMFVSQFETVQLPTGRALSLE